MVIIEEYNGDCPKNREIVSQGLAKLGHMIRNGEVALMVARKREQDAEIAKRYEATNGSTAKKVRRSRSKATDSTAIQQETALSAERKTNG